MEETILKEMKGVFNGYAMEVSENCNILVPENYASKSNILQGAIMIYYVTNKRTYFKQIYTPRPETALAKIVAEIGELKAEAIVEGIPVKFNFLLAYKTFFDLKLGDEVVISFPEFQNFDERYCIIENKIG